MLWRRMPGTRPLWCAKGVPRLRPCFQQSDRADAAHCPPDLLPSPLSPHCLPVPLFLLLQSLRGPRSGIIFFRKDDRGFERRINQAVFPALQVGATVLPAATLPHCRRLAIDVERCC